MLVGIIDYLGLLFRIIESQIDLSTRMMTIKQVEIIPESKVRSLHVILGAKKQLQYLKIR